MSDRCVGKRPRKIALTRGILGIMAGVAVSANAGAAGPAAPAGPAVPAPLVPLAPAVDKEKALDAMKRATRFMMDKLAVHGGFVWSYAADMSRRWGEMEAYPSMIWIQEPGTLTMGNLFIDVYHATGDEFYYQAASKTADGLIAGQHPAGGWNYMIDFAGEESLKKWYDTIGKNGWRLEEFQHYYGNATFDDSTTIDAARFMLRIYHEKKELRFKASLDKAIQFVLDAQYKNGGWPQRFPPTPPEKVFKKDGLPDYTGFITYNDGVCANNIEFLLQCYGETNDPRLPEAINRGMNGFLLTQGKGKQAGWGLQHDPVTLEPASARTYEPKGFVTHTTGANIEQCIKFYYLTGDKKFLARLPEALDWLDSVRLPADQASPRGPYPTFLEVGTGKPLYIHRSGSNAINGHYFTDQNPQNVIGHYSSFRAVNVAALRASLAEAVATPPETAAKDSPLRAGGKADELPRFMTLRNGPGGGAMGRGRGLGGGGTVDDRAAQVIAALDAQNRWLGPLRNTSHPYKPDAPREIPPGDFVRTNVGDEFDTSPYGTGGGPGGGVAAGGAMGITTSTYVANMGALIRYLEAKK